MQFMKKTLTLASILLIAGLTASAQDKSAGRIKYLVTMNLHLSLKPEQQQFKDLIPETATQEAVLLYKGQRFKTWLTTDTIKNDDNSGSSTAIHINSGNGEFLYADVDKGLQWSKKNGKFKESPLDVKKDRIVPADGTKQILGFECHKLLSIADKKDTTIVWYTNELPLKAGSIFNVLTDKGVVLEVEHKKISYVATEISYEPVKEEEVTPAGH
ncbi:hypothetical protein ACDQ55_13710 [Chitinophaga sp. 30R24]|uniref:hypothetical protein n=1 Tax=Chitinophaga sp. 30R24 TaxID=3248838 RepID=UPI003B8F0418